MKLPGAVTLVNGHDARRPAYTVAMDSPHVDRLKRPASRIADLMGTVSLLSWDQETIMPNGGTESRAHQLGTLAALIHEHYSDPSLGDLLRDIVAKQDERSEPGLIARAMLRQHEQRIKVPAELVVKRTELSTRAREAWKAARAADDFAAFAPFLSQQLELARELAGHLGYESNPYDALLDQFEPGTSYDWINDRFAAVKPDLKRLISAIAGSSVGSATEAARAVRTLRVPAQQQLDFSTRMAEFVGYSFNNGRLDLSAHPFTSGSSYMDVRITTRVDEEYFPSCLFAVIHEAGHGIHGQKLSPSLYRYPFRYGLAIAESQSRFYENILGRSRVFWEYHFPALQESIPAFREVDLDTWYRAINFVEPSLIRVEADEVTYGMHIMLRFEIENELINGRLEVGDLPAAWNDRMTDYLGVTPDDDADGVLQDIHWSQGGIGYFPDYLLGSMLSSQLWDALEDSVPDAHDQLRAGKLDAVNSWMADRVQKEGGKYTFAEIAEYATGREFSHESYIKYLRSKYEEIYKLDLE